MDKKKILSLFPPGEGTQHSENEDHGICPITSWQIDGETMETETHFILGASPESLQMMTVAMKLKDTFFLEEML